MKRALLLGALATASAAFAGSPGAAPEPKGSALAVRAGTIHLVEDGAVLTGNATLIVRDGRIVAAGVDLPIPADAHLVDYGPDAVIVPGLVAASSPLALGVASERTADAAVRAIDSFDPYTQNYTNDLSGGVTTAYLVPARARLIAGQGAVVKLGGSDAERRVLLESAAVQGSIDSDARAVPGYWEIPIPASVDVGLGRAEPQLPGSLMGAIVALRELLGYARGQTDLSKEYGKRTGPQLQELLQHDLPWRLRATSEPEIRALVELFKEERLPLIVEGAAEAGPVAAELASAGARVVLEVDAAPGNRQTRELSREKDARWPRYDVAVRLQQAGVPFAIATPDTLPARDLLFAAGLASRGGLSSADALRAITLSAAEVLGVAQRVGSLAPGKDADFAVLNGAPLAPGSSVLATWVNGELAWKAPLEKSAVVLEVDELYVGDGQVISPGQVLIVDGRIAEVARRVGHPRGALVVRGRAAMPGMIDATGHLGLEGSSKSAATDFKLARLVGPGDHVDRRVARAGVTTVILAPRGDTKSGTPMMAYKPAASDLDHMIVDDPAALRLIWSDRNRVDSGKDVKDLLEKAIEYDRKWSEYERALAAWQARPHPPESKPADAKAEGEKKEGEKADEKKGEEKKSDEAAKDEKKDEKKKDEKDAKKEGESKLEPYAGIWEADLVVPPWTDAAHLRLRLERDGELGAEHVVGSLRCAPVSETLVELAGTFKDGEVSVSGLGSRGAVSLRGKPKDAELEGELALGAARVELKAKRTSTELPRAERSERRREKKEDAAEPKDKPKAPGRDEKLEPLRRAMHGQAALVIQVDRREEIRDCLAACQRAGIRPILYGADDAWRMAAEIAGKVAGVVLSQQVLDGQPRGGLESVQNRFAALEEHGIPVAFQSDAEEGAAELPVQAAYAVALGLSPDAAVRALCADVARMFAIEDRVGLLAPGRDGDVLLLDGPPLEARTSVLRAWVAGEEVR